MKLHYIFYITIYMLFLMGCSSKSGPDLTPDASRKTINSGPDWYSNPPQKEGFILASGSATSQDMQMSVDKARTSAASALAGIIDSKWSGHIKSVKEEIGMAENSKIVDSFSNVQEQITSTRLRDIRVSKREVVEEKTDNGRRIYRAYVLVAYDEGAAQKRLLAKIKSDEQLYNAMRTTELYDEMEAKVDAYRQRLNEK